MEISEFHSRPGGLFKLLHDSGTRPAIRYPAPDDVDERKAKDDRYRDHQGHSMFQAKFSLLFAHLLFAIFFSLLFARSNYRALLFRVRHRRFDLQMRFCVVKPFCGQVRNGALGQQFKDLPLDVRPARRGFIFF